MSRAIKWSAGAKESLRMRLLRGADPEELKASFSKLVDSLIPPEDEILRLRREVAKLRRALDSKPK